MHMNMATGMSSFGGVAAAEDEQYNYQIPSQIYANSNLQGFNNKKNNVWMKRIGELMDVDSKLSFFI